MLVVTRGDLFASVTSVFDIIRTAKKYIGHWTSRASYLIGERIYIIVYPIEENSKSQGNGNWHNDAILGGKESSVVTVK